MSKRPLPLPIRGSGFGSRSAFCSWLASHFFSGVCGRKNARKFLPAPVIPPHERARQKLQQALQFLYEPVPFTVLVSDTIRLYLEERFTFRAPERTTEEFLHELQNSSHLTPDQKQTLGEFLSRCDLVKFARYEPTEMELRDLHAAAVRLVDETEPQFQEPGSSISSDHISQEFRIPETASKTQSSKGKTCAIVGICFQVTPLIWIFSYIIAIARMLNFLTHFKPNPSLMMEDVMKPFSKVISIYMDSLFLALFGLAIRRSGFDSADNRSVKFRYRAEWFFWFLIIYGILLVGTPFGIFFLVYCLVYRREFLNPNVRKFRVPNSPFRIQNDLRPSVSFTSVAGIARSRVASGKTRTTLRVCLFFRATGETNFRLKPFARRKNSFAAALVFTRAVHHRIGATASDQKRIQQSLQRN